MADFATAGNFPELRQAFFFLRQSAHERKISLRDMRTSEVEFIKGQILHSTAWNIAQAFALWTVVSRYRIELGRLGLDFSRVPQPQDAPVVKAAPARRINSVTFRGDRFIIFFQYNPTWIGALKRIPGWQYHQESREWSAPLTSAAEVEQFAQRTNLHVGEGARRAIASFGTNLDQSYSAQRVELNLPLKKTLFDYQTVGVDFSSRVMRAWITDEMGLGKTPQGIGYASAVNRWPFLVVCPKSLCQNWKNEIEAWTSYKAIILDRKNFKSLRSLTNYGLVNFVIVNNEGLGPFFAETIQKVAVKNGPDRTLITLKEMAGIFKGIIVDESHNFANPQNVTYKILNKLVASIEYRLLLTGTPYVNKPRDIAAQLQILGHIDYFGGMEKFVRKYGKALKEQDRDRFSAARRPSVELSELNVLLRSLCMIRREKHQVLKELPDKMRSVVPLEITNRAEYDHAFISLQSYLGGIGVSGEKLARAVASETLTRIGYLKQIAARGKMAGFKEFTDNILAQGEKVIVFCWYKETIETLKAVYPQLVTIYGEDSADEISRNKQLFQESPTHNIIAITYKKGGVGHTLTAAQNVIFLELGWNPKDQDQAEDRAHRIGQKNTVTCHYLLGADTLDEWIYELIDQKRQAHRQTTGSTAEVETSIQGDLIKKLTAKKTKKLIEA